MVLQAQEKAHRSLQGMGYLFAFAKQLRMILAKHARVNVCVLEGREVDRAQLRKHRSTLRQARR